MTSVQILNANETITVEFPDDISHEEVRHIASEEANAWRIDHPGKKIARIEITHDVGGFVNVRTVERSPIKRLRRITGYLSNLDNFNDAKRDELSERKAHV